MAMRTAPSPSTFRRLTEAFRTHVGPAAIDDLRAALTSVPIITIGGDQLTGKSTLTKQLAAELDAEVWSTGSIMRRLAADRGISVAEMSRQAADDPAIDANVVSSWEHTSWPGASLVPSSSTPH